MRELVPGADLDQLRGRAEELLRTDPSVTTSASAQLAVAREYGFPSWARCAAEVRRRTIFDRGDVAGLRALLAEQPALATERMVRWCDHRRGADPVGYLAMLRFDAPRLGLPGELPEVGALATILLEAGAPVEGGPGVPETPLMTAASYGDVEVARILIEAGAELEATSTSPGELFGLTPLKHATVFGMTAVVDLLVAAGARLRDPVDAAAAGDMTGLRAAAEPDRVRALRAAACHDRLAVLDVLLDAGTPVDGVARDGTTALHEAATHGRIGSVRRLIERGADPNLRDTEHGGTALDWCRHHRSGVGTSGSRDEVEALLAPLTVS